MQLSTNTVICYSLCELCTCDNYYCCVGCIFIFHVFPCNSCNDVFAVAKHILPLHINERSCYTWKVHLYIYFLKATYFGEADLSDLLPAR